MSAGPQWITAAEANSQYGELVMTDPVVFTNDQILGSADTALMILSPTSVPNYSGFPTEIFIPISAFCYLDASAGAYDGDMTFQLFNSEGNQLSQGGGTVVQAAGIFGVDVGACSLWPIRSDNIHDNGVYLSADADPLWGGNAANTLTVTLYYLKKTI